MKYSTRDLPPPTVDRDFASRPSESSPLFRDLIGAVALFAEVGLIVFLLMGA